MHELSIAQSILDAVRQEQENRRLPAIEEVGIRVGALSGVLADSLEFCFASLVLDTPLENCRLVIELVPVRGTCEACGADFEVENLIFSCPNCDAIRIRITAGYDLDLAYITADDGIMAPT